MEENKKIKKFGIGKNLQRCPSSENAYLNGSLNQKNLLPDFCFYRTEIDQK